VEGPDDRLTLGLAQDAGEGRALPQLACGLGGGDEHLHDRFGPLADDLPPSFERPCRTARRPCGQPSIDRRASLWQDRIRILGDVAGDRPVEPQRAQLVPRQAGCRLVTTCERRDVRSTEAPMGADRDARQGSALAQVDALSANIG